MNKSTLMKHFGFKFPPCEGIQKEEEIYLSVQMKNARDAILDTIENIGFHCLLGEIGTGKDTIIGEVEEAVRSSSMQHKTHVMQILDLNHRMMSGATVLGAIYDLIRKSKPRSRTVAMERLRGHLGEMVANGHRIAIILNEAQSLNRWVLRAVKNLSEIAYGRNRRLISFIFVGHPDTPSKIAAKAPDLWARIEDHNLFELKSMSRQESVEYVNRRLDASGSNPFTAAAVEELVNGGRSPVSLNALVWAALGKAFAADSKTVDKYHVLKALGRKLLTLQQYMDEHKLTHQDVADLTGEHKTNVNELKLGTYAQNPDLIQRKQDELISKLEDKRKSGEMAEHKAGKLTRKISPAKPKEIVNEQAG